MAIAFVGFRSGVGVVGDIVGLRYLLVLEEKWVGSRCGFDCEEMGGHWSGLMSSLEVVC